MDLLVLSLTNLLLSALEPNRKKTMRSADIWIFCGYCPLISDWRLNHYKLKGCSVKWRPQYSKIHSMLLKWLLPVWCKISGVYMWHKLNSNSIYYQGPLKTNDICYLLRLSPMRPPWAHPAHVGFLSGRRWGGVGGVLMVAVVGVWQQPKDGRGFSRSSTRFTPTSYEIKIRIICKSTHNGDIYIPGVSTLQLNNHVISFKLKLYTTLLETKRGHQHSSTMIKFKVLQNVPGEEIMSLPISNCSYIHWLMMGVGHRT